MDEQNRNLILATVLSFVVILVWFVLFPPPEPIEPATAPQDGTAQTAQPADVATPTTNAPATATTTPVDPIDAPRIAIETPRLTGSLSLAGGRIDTLKLKDYRETIEDDSPIVTLLSPVGSDHAYYALYGWAPGPGVTPEDVPGPRSEWTQVGEGSLTPATPVTLTWTGASGLTFTRTVSVDDDFMFTVTQSVTNGTSQNAALAPYGILARHGEPEDLKNFFILHEGGIRMADGELSEIDYGDMADFEPDARGVRADTVSVEQNGWIGFTDHYWMTTIIPQPGTPFRASAKYIDTRDIYQTEAVLPTQTVAPGDSAAVTTQLFAGAKVWESITAYQDAGVEGFVDSIDWGWFFFLTKPIFIVLHWFNLLIGNMGWAIIGLTLFIKALLFPLAYRSYVSMAKMKELQPEMEKLKERAGDDRQKLQQEMMALYKKEKVNPAAGCLPILLQIPIFFSLYKVIFVTLDLRHAPWIGWIRDLSAPDPSSILNLFGLLPYGTPDPSSILFIFSLGVLPIFLGISMWLQQKLNPAPTDPTQAMIFAWLPWVFMFMLGTFASGLVLYWIANNLITFAQQYIIMRSQGYKPDLFGNIKAGFKRKSRE
ncbi:membrane protein insertase YidC [Pseudaestuariivita atlantica]|uniref:Membrane protein insertase YidC n=1 Tax=Pseudaestuariivita atlantica TaxID=1317121 RepID=A0A0L1JKQ0_9RHOB|nr:membrane protein insertase YidC [Pseudaestuariivita atlantica]KNG92302.1 insertase [Pseudaestuariivita atlantica]